MLSSLFVKSSSRCYFCCSSLSKTPFSYSKIIFKFLIIGPFSTSWGFTWTCYTCYPALFNSSSSNSSFLMISISLVVELSYSALREAVELLCSLIYLSRTLMDCSRILMVYSCFLSSSKRILDWLIIIALCWASFFCTSNSLCKVSFSFWRFWNKPSFRLK